MSCWCPRCVTNADLSAQQQRTPFSSDQDTAHNVVSVEAEIFEIVHNEQDHRTLAMALHTVSMSAETQRWRERRLSLSVRKRMLEQVQSAVKHGQHLLGQSNPNYGKTIADRSLYELGLPRADPQ